MLKIPVLGKWRQGLVDQPPSKLLLSKFQAWEGRCFKIGRQCLQNGLHTHAHVHTPTLPYKLNHQVKSKVSFEARRARLAVTTSCTEQAPTWAAPASQILPWNRPAKASVKFAAVPEGCNLRTAPLVLATSRAQSSNCFISTSETNRSLCACLLPRSIPPKNSQQENNSPDVATQQSGGRKARSDYPGNCFVPKQ